MWTFVKLKISFESENKIGLVTRDLLHCFFKSLLINPDQYKHKSVRFHIVDC